MSFYALSPEDWRVERNLILAEKPAPLPTAGRFGLLLESFLDLFNGIYSGFPLCCVISYIMIGWSSRKQRGLKRYLECVNNQEDYDIFNKVYYVPCCRCFKKRHFVKTEPEKNCLFSIGWLYKG